MKTETTPTALIDAAPRSRLGKYLGTKPVSLREARAAGRRVAEYEHIGGIRETELLDVMVSLVLASRSIEAPLHRLVPQVLEAWELRLL